MKKEIIHEIIGYSFISIVEEMGIALRKSSYSHNIKERSDHSCIIFDYSGKIIAQVEHLPVHLGSYYVGIKNFLFFINKNDIKIEKGDIFIVNDPYIIGTHLNDITLIKPVFYNDELVCFVSNKAHHVDVGGINPGSISWNVKNLYQEGIVITPCKIFKKDKLNKSLVNSLKSLVRTPNIFYGDLMAQISSLKLGERRIVEILNKHGLNKVKESWDIFINYTYKKTLLEFSKLNKGEAYAEDFLETKNKLIKISANVSISDKKISINFENSHKQINKPLNAVLGVTFAAASFSIRTLIKDPELPINEGFYKTIEIKVKEGSLLNPKKPSPVSLGNTETSQRIVDVIYKALSKLIPERIPSASQGTMNNIIISSKNKSSLKWVYYETIGGGYGARYGKDGINAVHVNMTNTMNTPIEELERSYPIRIIKYEIRENSFGIGKWRGGCGIEKGFVALSKMYLSVSCERVRTKPYGLKGGFDGKSNELIIIKNNRKIKKTNSKFSTVLKKGDIFIIKTPGGGGYGNPLERDLKLIKKDIENGYLSVEEAKKFKNINFIQ